MSHSMIGAIQALPTFQAARGPVIDTTAAASIIRPTAAHHFYYLAHCKTSHFLVLKSASATPAVIFSHILSVTVASNSLKLLVGAVVYLRKIDLGNSLCLATFIELCQ